MCSGLEQMIELAQLESYQMTQAWPRTAHQLERRTPEARTAGMRLTEHSLGSRSLE